MMQSATPTVPLQFESEPAGAEVKTSGGQTCRTPCALAIPAADFTATYTLNGYQPQTIAVKLVPPDEARVLSEFGPQQPRFDQNPVMAEMVKATPVRRPARKPRAAQPRPAAPETAPAAETAPAQPAAPQPYVPPAPSPWPPATSPIR
jgi:hypothetical protein